jgi:hypothetical protein
MRASGRLTSVELKGDHHLGTFELVYETDGVDTPPSEGDLVTFTTMMLLSLLTQGSVPEGVVAKMLVMHAPERLRIAGQHPEHPVNPEVLA